MSQGVQCEYEKQVSALKAEALRAHASMVSSTEKQKLKILYLSKSSHVRNEMQEPNGTELVRDFSILRQAFEMHSSSVRFTFEREARNSLSLMKQQQIVL